MQCLSSLLLIFYNGIFVSANILLRLARSTCTAQCEDGVTKRHRKARYWSSKFSKVSLIELRTLHNFETPFSFIFMKLFWTIHNMLSYCICMMYINTCISISRRILLKWCHLAKIQQRAREGGRYLMETDSATGFICFESVRLCWLNKFLCSEKKASYETVQVLQLKSIFHKGLSAIKQLSLWISPVLNPTSSEKKVNLARDLWWKWSPASSMLNRSAAMYLSRTRGVESRHHWNGAQVRCMKSCRDTKIVFVILFGILELN